MSIVCKHLGVNFIDTHINKTKRDKYEKYYNEESKSVIENIYKDDIEMYHYRYDQ
jgi:hypothetical protein